VLRVQIQDRGTGFEPGEVLPAKNTGGLAGMRERAELLGGRLTLESAPGKGTRVIVELPLRERLT
jgi:signal transduction histidine kinase